MDSDLLNSLYSKAVCIFTDAESIVAKQDIYGTWPVNYKTTRTLLLYIYALSLVVAGTAQLTDAEILMIMSRVDRLKYKQ